MALNFFNFTKSWRNKNDFPTYESNETKVRDDMQSLFDELKDGLNGLITNLFAGNIPFNATSAVAADNVQDAIEEVQSQIVDIVIDQLPDNSVTSAKLADEAVTEDKIADGAVTADKLDDSALDGKADLVNGVLKGSQNAREIVSVDTPRTLALTDSGKLLIVESATKTVLTIPQNSSVAFPVGTEIEVYREGIGEVAFAFDGVSASVSEPDRDAQNRFTGLKRWHTALLKKVDADTWQLEYIGSVPNGSITTDKLADGAVSTVYTLDIGTDGWQSYMLDMVYKTVSVPGVRAADKLFARLDTTGVLVAKKFAMGSAWSMLMAIDAGENSVTFYMAAAPETAMHVDLMTLKK